MNDSFIYDSFQFLFAFYDNQLDLPMTNNKKNFCESKLRESNSGEQTEIIVLFSLIIQITAHWWKGWDFIKTEQKQTKWGEFSVLFKKCRKEKPGGKKSWINWLKFEIFEDKNKQNKVEITVKTLRDKSCVKRGDWMSKMKENKNNIKEM